MFKNHGHTSERLRNLLVNDDIDAHAPLGCSLQHAIQSVLFILRRWPSQIKFGR